MRAGHDVTRHFRYRTAEDRRGRRGWRAARAAAASGSCPPQRPAGRGRSGAFQSRAGGGRYGSGRAAQNPRITFLVVKGSVRGV